MERLVILPIDDHDELARELSNRVSAIARQITAQNIVSAIGESALRLANSSHSQAVREIVLWARSEARFLAAWTSVAPESEVVGNVSWDGENGLIAEIFRTETGRSKQEPILQAPAFTNLGECRGRQISSITGTPLIIFGYCVGTVSSVYYQAAGAEVSAALEDDVAKLAAIFSVHLELRIIKSCLGI